MLLQTWYLHKYRTVTLNIIKCTISVPVTPLVSSETAGHLQSGSADPQGAGHSHSGVSQWPDTDPCTNSDTALIWRSTASRPTDTYRTCSTRFLCRSPIHLELFTCRHSTVRERSLIKAPYLNLWNISSVCPSVAKAVSLHCCCLLTLRRNDLKRGKRNYFIKFNQLLTRLCLQ